MNRTQYLSSVAHEVFSYAKISWYFLFYRLAMRKAEQSWIYYLKVNANQFPWKVSVMVK